MPEGIVWLDLVGNECQMHAPMLQVHCPRGSRTMGSCYCAMRLLDWQCDSPVGLLGFGASLSLGVC